MEWKFNFRDDGILETKAKGVFTIDDLRALVLQMISDSRWKPGINRLFNCIELDAKTIDINTMFNIGKIQQEFVEELGGGRLAILVKNTIDYGAGISYKDIVNEKIKSKVQIFLNYDKATEWLKNP